MKFFTKPPLGTPLNPAHPLNRGLVGYWPFAEGAGGKTMDLSGKGNNGTLTNMVQGPTSGWTGGNFGGAMRFDGTNDFVAFTAPDISSSSFSISSWISTRDQSSRAWFSIGNQSIFNKIIHLAYVSGTSLRFGFYGDDNSFTYTLTNNKRYHAVFTYNNSTNERILYVNGVHVGTGSGNAFTGTTVGRIGSWINSPNNYLYWNGSIDEVRVHNRALSASEVQQLYTDPFCMYEQKSIFRWFKPGGVVARAGSFFFGR